MKESNIDVEVHHITRVEGHGNINVNIKNGLIEKCEWSIPEAPRFFEAMVVGRSWNELHHITSRIWQHALGCRSWQRTASRNSKQGLQGLILIGDKCPGLRGVAQVALLWRRRSVRQHVHENHQGYHLIKPEDLFGGRPT